MKKKFTTQIEVPQDVTCILEGQTIICSKGQVSVSKKIGIPEVVFKVSDGKVVISCAKVNKKKVAAIKANVAHIYNLFKGLGESFDYTMEICNVHFPMTVKIDGNKLIINNFLGEKRSRVAEIVEGVKLDVKGNKITLSSSSLEKAGQTAANIEKATKVSKRDRRIFQDGIFITSKPGVEAAQ